MRILKVIMIIIAVFALIILGGILVLPSASHVERSTVIDAPRSEVYAALNGFENFNKWSPWAQIDPDNTEYSFEGPSTGVGAKMSWTSTNSDVGSGSQEIVESTDSEIKVEMYFDGFDDPAYAAYVLEDEGAGTKVTWTFDTELSGFGKFWGLMMDGMLGPQYDQGLSNMKSMIEG